MGAHGRPPGMGRRGEWPPREGIGAGRHLGGWLVGVAIFTVITWGSATVGADRFLTPGNQKYKAAQKPTSPTARLLLPQPEVPP